jgi:hypothetical protein
VALRENSGGFIQLNISFTRVAHDWEVDVFASFFRVSYLARVGLECKDNCCGSLPKQGCLFFKSFYTVMGCNCGFRFLWKSIWRTKVHLRVAFFVWSVAQGRSLP